MNTLNITVTIKNSIVYSGDPNWTAIDFIVVSQGQPVPNANIALSINSDTLTGTFQPTSGLSNVNGYFTTRFKANTTSRYDINVVATKTGFNNGTTDFEIIAVDAPVQYVTNNILYLNIIEKRKLDIIAELQSYLDDDPAFYQSTGASNKITYQTEWNYDTKNFPLIVISSENPNYEKVGLNQIIDDTTSGGFVDITFGINLICTDKTTLDKLTEKCIFLLSTLKFYEFYGKYGMHIRDVNTGATFTEPYAAKLLYANKISMATRIEFAYNISPNLYITGLATS